MKNGASFDKLKKRFEAFSARTPLNFKNVCIQLDAHLDLLFKYMIAEGRSYDTGEDYYTADRVDSQLGIVIMAFVKILSPYREIILREYKSATSGSYSPRDTNIYRLLEHCIDLLDIAVVGEEDIEEGKIFLGIKEKLKQAGQSFRNQDYPGLFSCLHTAVELALKDKLSIPLSIGEIKIGRVIGECIQDRVFPSRETMLKDLDNKICQIDNKIKHYGYHPSADEASQALLVAEQSLRLLEKDSPNLNEETKRKISALLL